MKEQTAHADQATTSDATQGDSASTAGQLRGYLTRLWPVVVGLAFGRAGLIVSSYGSYTSTDEGIFTDGAMLMALFVLSLGLLAITFSKHTLSKRAVNRLMRVCVALEAFTLFALLANDLFLHHADLRLALSALSTLVASLVIYYWLRRARGSSTTTAAIFVFAALFLSEIEIYLCSLMPKTFALGIAGLLVLAQYPCMVAARRHGQLYDIASPTQASDYFGFTKTMISSKQFLSSTAIGIALLSIVIGLLRGYPNGASIAFTPATRSAYGFLTMLICVCAVLGVLHGKKRIMTVGMFLLMESLAFMALILYAAFPDMLDLGAVFATTLNAVMVGFTWYIIIAFMSYGWRDPYYYAIAGWLVFLGARAIARIALLGIYELSGNDILMNALMGALIVISTQVVFAQFLGIARFEQEQLHEKLRQREEADHKKEVAHGVTQHRSALTKLMGLDEHESLAEVRQASMQHNAEEMGRQFLLSEREIEVLALYALGYTQKRVAEELYITPSTAHAHIKRIYAKTGLHSRQEVLDYLEKYAS